MNRVYPNRIDWKNKPSTNTPINETNLNKIDYAVYEIDGRVVGFDLTKANQSDLLQTIKTLTYDTTTGVFVFEFWNGGTYTVDLNIEKIPVSFSMSESGVITMVTADGTTYTCDISTLIKLYTFVDSSEIDFTTTTDASGNKTITAQIKAGSITGDKLQPNYLADCVDAKNSAESAATDADADALKAEGFAVGQQNGTDVPSTSPYYHNNAKWYSEQANPTTLANLTDTDIDNPQANQPLSYDGEKWINNPYLELVSPSEKNIWNEVQNLYQYALVDKIAQVNTNVEGHVPAIAVRNYAAGEYFIQQKKLLRALTAISQGDTLTQGSNYEEVTVTDDLYSKDITNDLTWNTTNLSFTHKSAIRYGNLVTINLRFTVLSTVANLSIITDIPSELMPVSGWYFGQVFEQWNGSNVGNVIFNLGGHNNLYAPESSGYTVNKTYTASFTYICKGV